MHPLSSISHMNSSAIDRSALEGGTEPPTNVALVLSRFSQNSAKPGPQVLPTPSFVRDSLPEMNARQRHVSPDFMAENAIKRPEVAVKSAEFGRKRSSTVLSLLQKQFGDRK